ncbi:MAG: hypothetical protein Q8867_03835 [Bacteroidota bacterium]|nr:hypothetical protein [Bacteroidota bacterium]
MSKSGYKFDEVARSERYFTSYLLPLLLSHNDFTFLKFVIQKVFNEKLDHLKNDFEIVTELDPLRDGSVSNDTVKAKYKEFKRVAVPDLFLRWDSKILIIEAKFFTSPKKEELEDQIIAQKKAIDEVKSETKYRSITPKHIALTIQKISLRGFESYTWDEIISWAEESIRNKPTQIIYALDVLRNAVIRAKEEDKPGDRHWKKYSFDQILDQLPKFLREGKIYFAFSKGEAQLRAMKLPDLQNRSHYKVSDVQISDNWLTIDQLIKRYIEVKHNTENDAS